MIGLMHCYSFWFTLLNVSLAIVQQLQGPDILGNTDEFVSVLVFLISNRSKENKVEGICLAVDDSVTTCQHLSTQPSLPLRISKL